MFKKLLVQTLMLGATMAMGALIGIEAKLGFQGTVADDKQPCPSIERIRELSMLVTTQVDVADVQETQIVGWTGGVKVALLVKGDFQIGIDFSKARFISIDERSRAVVLSLPTPTVNCVRLDHHRTKVFGLTSYGL